QRSPYCRAHRHRPSDSRPIEDERRGSAPASRTVAFLREGEIPGKGLQPLSTKARIKMGSSAGVCVAVLPSPRTVGSFLISSIPAPEKAKDSPGFPFLA